MMHCLLDSNVLIYLLQRRSPFHRQTVETLRRLALKGATFFMAPQTIYEFWVMATRPIVDGGLGYDPAAARGEIQRFLLRYQLLDDTRFTWLEVIDMAVSENIIGRRIHDARLVAIMKAHGLAEVVSFDRDFDGFAGITRIVPTL